MNPGRIESVRRLVQDQELWVGKQCAGNPESLAHAEGVALDAVVCPVGQADAREHSFDPCMRFRPTRRSGDCEVLPAGEEPVKAGLLHDRAYAGECRLPRLGNRRAQKSHRARARTGEAEQQPDERRLTGSVRPEEAEGAPTRDGEVEIGERGALSESFRETVHFDGVVAHLCDTSLWVRGCQLCVAYAACFTTTSARVVEPPQENPRCLRAVGACCPMAMALFDCLTKRR